jgi:hypothetical protein
LKQYGIKLYSTSLRRAPDHEFVEIVLLENLIFAHLDKLLRLL